MSGHYDGSEADIESSDAYPEDVVVHTTVRSEGQAAGSLQVSSTGRFPYPGAHREDLQPVQPVPETSSASSSSRAPPAAKSMPKHSPPQLEVKKMPVPEDKPPLLLWPAHERIQGRQAHDAAIDSGVPNQDRIRPSSAPGAELGGTTDTEDDPQELAFEGEEPGSVINLPEAPTVTPPGVPEQRMRAVDDFRV